MKKHIFTLLLLTLTGLSLQANPVGQETARRLGQSFVSSNFEFTRQSADLSLAYTAFSDRGEACYYVFNVGETGFVIIAGDDHYRPVIGYSDQGVFNPDDMAPALADYLEGVRQGVMAASMEPSASFAVAADWAMLDKTGRMVSRHGGREDEYLVETKWNQNSPYNYYCPEAPGGPGGRAYAGCVATAAAQLMRYWNHPVQGQGSYSYVPEDHPEYGQLYANFGETVYDWEHMPLSLSGASQEEIEAVALLIYHVGVCMDMNYSPTGSGAVTGRLCEKMPMYFFYTDQMANLYREEYTHEEYMQLVIKAIDMDWPMVHRGGGHAYVLDGYNDYDMVHFNWGWGGSSDGWFNVDDHGYTDGESVIYNYVPAAIYAATPDQPTDLVVEPAHDGTLMASLTWKNPTQTLTHQSLDVIDQIVVERNGQVVFAEDNPTPGAEMSFVDETVPYYDVFDYAVYAVVDGQRGASMVAEKVLVSPTCDWKIIMQSSSMQGWKGGYVSLYSASGKEICRMTTSSSSPETIDFAVPVGSVSFGWTRPRSNVNNITILIKDAENNNVYTYQGSTSGLAEGILHEANNGCGNPMTLQAPYNLNATIDEGVATLTWEMDGDEPEYGYIIYRDEQHLAMVIGGEARSFIDEDVATGHCYTVSALGLGGETAQSNETCASSGDCMGASNFDYEYVGEQYKIKLHWDKPEVYTGLSGYYLYRKDGDDGVYERIRLLGSNATSYTDNTANVEGNYYYRLYAYYRDIDCTSAPATLKDDPSMFYLKVYYSPTDVAENEASTVNVYPNPARQRLSIEAEGMTGVTVCDMLGQVVCHQETEGNMLTISVSDWSEGIYLVKVNTRDGQLVRRVSVVH